MIPSSKPMQIRSYLNIDRCAEGISWIRAEDGEEFVGIPHSYYSDDSRPFIEVRQGGTVVRTINCDDVSEIMFAQKEPDDE